MYIPKAFKITNLNILHSFIEQYSFAAIITHTQGFNTSHIPFVLDRTQGQFGTLTSHLSNRNQQLQDFDGKNEALIIFKGPHSFISKDSYGTQPSVPTWDYTVVHAYGKPYLVDIETLKKDLFIQMDKYEKGNKQMDPQYFQKLIGRTTGFKLAIDRIEGKFKLDQNMSDLEQENMCQWLERQGNLQLVEFIRNLKNQNQN